MALPDRRLTFGLGLFTGQTPPEAPGPPYAEAVVLADQAERAGFDAFWVSEHHGWADAYLPAPLTLLAAVAAGTQRIALGCGVVLAPLYHPVRLAEDAAVVDHLSRGRLILGMGIGYDVDEYATFGIEESTRGRDIADKAAFLRRAWSGQRFSWDGPTFRFHDVRVTPTPYGEGIPVWFGGYAPAAIRRAGTIGDGYLIGRGDAGIVRDATALLAQVRDPADPSFTLAVNVLAVLDGPGGTAASARQGFAYQQATYEARQRGRDTYAGRVADPVGGVTLDAASIDPYLHAHGGADAVVAALRGVMGSLSAWARLHVVLRILFPEPDVEAQIERVRTFGREILPRLSAASQA